jgi:hypothetical protein
MVHLDPGSDRPRVPPVQKPPCPFVVI